MEQSMAKDFYPDHDTHSLMPEWPAWQQQQCHSRQLQKQSRSHNYRIHFQNGRRKIQPKFASNVQQAYCNRARNGVSCHFYRNSSQPFRGKKKERQRQRPRLNYGLPLLLYCLSYRLNDGVPRYWHCATGRHAEASPPHKRTTILYCTLQFIVTIQVHNGLHNTK